MLIPLKRDIHLQAHSASGGAITPTRSARHSPSYCPCGLFKGQQHYFAIVAPTARQFQALCEVIGRPELDSHPDFAGSNLRVKQLPLIEELIEGWLASMPSDEAALRVLDEHPSRWIAALKPAIGKIRRAAR